jgi:hypothetical protein
MGIEEEREQEGTLAMACETGGVKQQSDIRFKPMASTAVQKQHGRQDVLKARHEQE